MTNRVHLIHWHAAEAKQRAKMLRHAGFQVDVHTDAAPLRAIRENPPDAFVIDLSRRPSGGRDVAIWLRQRKATRGVPIVFAGGDPEKVAQVRELLPDAGYAEWRRIRGVLRRAIGNPPADPVVAGAMDGYSRTPLPKKLGIRAGSVVALLGAPADFARKLGPVPDDVQFRTQARGGPADVILLFAKSHAGLERRFPAAARALAEGGGLWIVWPKKASGVATDLTQPAVRAFGLGRGFVDYKICSVDETFSGLLFARRRPRLW